MPGKDWWGAGRALTGTRQGERGGIGVDGLSANTIRFVVLDDQKRSPWFKRIAHREHQP